MHQILSNPSMTAALSATVIGLLLAAVASLILRSGSNRQPHDVSQRALVMLVRLAVFVIGAWATLAALAKG
jgi:hypothetical protein